MTIEERDKILSAIDSIKTYSEIDGEEIPSSKIKERITNAIDDTTRELVSDNITISENQFKMTILELLSGIKDRLVILSIILIPTLLLIFAMFVLVAKLFFKIDWIMLNL